MNPLPNSSRVRFAIPAPGSAASILSGPLYRRARFALPMLMLFAGTMVFVPAPSARAQNTTDTVNSGASLALDNGANYSAGLPGTTCDVVFASGNTYSGTFTINTNPLSIGTLDDLSTTAITISASKALTLNGGTDAAAAPGTAYNYANPYNSTNAADLLYVTAGGSMTIGGTGGIVLGAAGNFDVAATGLGVGSLTINSVISDASGQTYGLTKTGTGTLTLSAANTYTGATTVAQGTLALNFSATTATNIISSSSTLVLGGLGTSGGGLAYQNPTLPTLLATAASNTASSQTFNGTTINSGADVIIARGNGTGSMTINLGAISLNSTATAINAGGTILFNDNTSGGSGTGVITTTTANDATGILGGYAVINAAGGNNSTFQKPTAYAVSAGTGTVAGAISAYVATGANALATSGAALTSNALANYQVTASGVTALTAAAGAITNINTLSLVPAATSNTTLTIGAGGTLQLGATGGFLTGNGAGTLTIAGGSLTAGSTAAGGTVYLQQGGGALVITSNIVNNSASGPVAVVFDSYNGNAGTANLAGTNSFSGGLYLNAGRFQSSASGQVGTGSVYIAPGAQFFASSSSTYSNNFFVEGSSQFTADTPSAIRQGTYTGTTTLLGDAALFNATFNGQITGSGDLIAGRGTVNSGAIGGTVTLGNASGTALNNYTGNTIVSEGTLYMNAANQIPSGSTAGNVIIASTLGTATFDLHGFNQSINGLSSGSAAVGTGIVTSSNGGVSALLTLGNNNATATYNGSILQNFGLAITKVGTGTQTFGGAGSYTGATLVNAGTLSLLNNGTGTLGATAITVGNTANATAGLLQVGAPGATATYTIGTGTQTTGTGAASLTLTPTYGNFSLLSAGVNTLAINTASTTGLSIGGGNTLSFDVGTSTSDQISLSANSKATAAGSNTVNLNLLGRASTNTTFTLINAPGAGSTLNGGTFTLGTVTGASTFGLSLTLNAPTANTLTLSETVAPAPGTAYFVGSQGASFAANNGTVSNFSSDSAGTTLETQLPAANTDVHLYATNANTATVAATTLDQAFVVRSLTVDGSTLGESSPVGIASGAGGVGSSLTTLVGGITVNSGAGAVTISAPVVLGATQTVTNNSANLLTLSGGIGDGGTASTIGLAGTGVITLSGTTSGTVNGTVFNITAPTVNANGVNTFGTLAAINVADGSTLNLSASQTFGSLNNPGTTANSGGVTIASGSTLTIGNTNNLSSAFTGVISGGGSLTKGGTGTAILSAANSYTGATTVNGGTLTLTTAVGGVGSAANNLTVGLSGGSAGATFNLPSGSALVVSNIIDGGFANPSMVLNIAGNINGSTGSQNILDGTTTITAGTVTLKDVEVGAGGNTGEFGSAYVGGTGALTVSTGNFNALNVGQRSTGNLYVSGGGTVSNSGGTNGGSPGIGLGAVYSGAVSGEKGTIVQQGGTVNATTGITFGPQTAAGSTASSGIYFLNGGTFNTNSITIGPGTGNTGSQLNFGGGTLKSLAAFTVAASSSSVFATTINSGGATIDTTGGNITWNGVIAAGTTGNVTGFTTLNGGSGYTPGQMPVTFSAPASGTTATGVAIVNQSGVVTDIVVTNPGSGYTSAPTITFGSGAASATATFSTASGGLTKIGANTLTLAGANTYVGPTTASGGTLLVNGSIGSAATPAGILTVTAGTLGGAGSLTVTSATVNSGATLAPGATTGATTGALTLNTTSGLTINGNLTIGVAGGGDTSLSTNGVLTLSGATLTINGSLNGTSNYDIANYGTLAAGSTFAGFVAPSGYTINYAGTNFGASDIELDVAAVPEPATWIGAVLALVGGAVTGFRRKVRGV